MAKEFLKYTLYITLFSVIFFSFSFFKFYPTTTNLHYDFQRYTVEQINENVLINRSEARRGRYFVFDKKCKMPFVDAFSNEAMNKYKSAKFKNCTDKPDLISVVYSEKHGQYALHVNENYIDNIEQLNDDELISCKYNEIQLLADSHVIAYQDVYFEQGTLIPLNITGIVVTCQVINSTRIIQKDAFAFVQYRNESESSQGSAVQKRSSPRKPSVVIIGIDTMSRMNFRRTMPLTAAYLNNSGWYEMQGYNKVADSTLPNLMAILTGLTSEVSDYICDTDDRGCFDRLPFVWRNFKWAGYMTAYAEDVASINTFTYLKPGFVTQPVDYYLLPFLFGIEAILKTQSRFGTSYCVGRRLSISYIFDYCSQFIKRYITKRPIFGLFWTSSFTHDAYYGGTALDGKFLNYLKSYEDDGLFEESIVILLSDHGSRSGALTELTDGFLEERLPMLYIWLPPWLRQEHPEFVDALNLNRNRLTSNYDLHFTLKHVIELGNPDIYYFKGGDCPTCQSLFRTIPTDRSCLKAGISEHWCTCNSYVNETQLALTTHITKLITKEINQYLIKQHVANKCMPLTLLQLISAERRVILNRDGEEDIYSSLIVYRLKFKTYPEHTIFQATVIYNRHSESLENFDINSISRLSAYRKKFQCVYQSIVRKFCACK